MMKPMQFKLQKKKKVAININSDNSYDKITIIDWFFFSVCATICFLLFSQVDIRITAEHSLVLLEGHILDFYSACYSWNGAYAANYLPSTYIAFALWNFPLKILGAIPTIWGQSETLMFWYKLLPICVYLLSGCVLYKICTENFKFSRNKSYLAMFIFWTTPIGFFSQFIFCQYDIFTVFFMLLGLRHYYADEKCKKNYILFVVYFGIAVTFKYYALFIFLVLLLIKYKKLNQLLLGIILSCCPFALEFLICFLLDGESFKNAVMGFNTLEYVKNGEISVGIDSIRLLPLVLLIIIAWSYFAPTKDRQDEIKYSLFFSCGICFALFTLMTWHPQWILFTVPFLVLSIMINKYYDIFLWLDTIFILFLYTYTVNRYEGNVDENMLRNGILSSNLKYREIGTSLTMKDILRFGDIDLIYTVMVAILAVNFIFKHPRYCFEEIGTEFAKTNINTETVSLKGILRIRLLVTVLAFLIPALICLPTMLEQKVLLWSRDDTYASNVEYIGISNTEILQPITLQGEYVSEIRVKTANSGNNPQNSYMSVSIIESDSNKVLGTDKLSCNEIVNGGESIFKFDDISIRENEKYFIKISMVGAQKANVFVLCAQTPTNNYQLDAVQQIYDGDFVSIDDKQWNNYYCIIDILGE